MTMHTYKVDNYGIFIPISPDSIDSSYRSAISKDNGVLKDYFTNFLTNIQIKIESGQSVNFTIEESEFLMNLLTNVIDNGMLNGNENTEIESD